MNPLTPSELTAFGAIFLIAMFALKLLAWMIKNKDSGKPRCVTELLGKIEKLEVVINLIKSKVENCPVNKGQKDATK